MPKEQTLAAPENIAPICTPVSNQADAVIAGANPYFGACFSLRNRVARAIWGVVYVLAFRPSPRPLFAWRALLLRAFGARLGHQAHVYPATRIWAPWNLDIGDRVKIGNDVIIYNMGLIRIGDYAQVSSGSHLCGGSHDADSANFQLTIGPIDIAPYVWICSEAFIAQNVQIPEGAVIAARAVVTHSLTQPWTYYAGIPARPIRARKQNLKNHMEAMRKASGVSGVPPT